MVLDEEEQERFRREAEIEGRSLSSWLRQAGREKLASRRARRLSTAKDLAAFFKACDLREKGREPDWDQHRAVIERSQRGGNSQT